MTTPKDVEDITLLIMDIKLRRTENSLEVALRTHQLLEALISNGRWNTALELMNMIKLRLRKVIELLPHETIVNNVMWHILKIVREKHDAVLKCKGEDQSTLVSLVTADPDQENIDYSQPLPCLKAALLTYLEQYKRELENSSDSIAAQAYDHIHANEMILVIGHSETVEKFLTSAAKTRKFQVTVVEAAPDYRGHNMAVNLAENGIETVIIPDTAIFAMMSRMNKVIIGTNTVMANGGLRAISGVNTVALAAKHYNVPVIVLAHLYKLSPIHVCSHEQETFNIFVSPRSILPSFGTTEDYPPAFNPMFDYVAPEYLSLFITHQGGNAPTYVYRLLSQLYHPDDYVM